MRSNREQVEANKRQRDKKRDLSKGASKPRQKAALDFEKPAADDEMGWLKAYLPEAFPNDFGKVHYDIKDAFNYSIKTGNNSLILAPRGTGKSTEVNGLTLRALLEGIVKFPVVIPWDAKARNRALRFWKNALCFNERLHRDYPEATAVFKESRGIALRLAALTNGDESTGAMLSVSEGIIVLPGGLGAIGSATINGNPRGMFYSSIDGSIVRPSMVIIDDPQDKDVAKSAAMVRDTMDMIDSDIAGMAGPDSRMPMVMSATVLADEDVPSQYYKNKSWRSVRVGQVITWPNGWEDENAQCRTLWEECNLTRLEHGEEAAIDMYLKHKAVMADGMTVSWDDRFDKKRGIPDALYGAIMDFFILGERSFMAERMNDPIKEGVTVFTLKPEHITARTDNDRPPLYVPEWSRLVIAATDLNPSYAFTWGVGAFGGDQRAGVLSYGFFKDAPLPIDSKKTPAEKERLIFEALVLHGKKLAALPCRPNFWTVDAGGAQFSAVLKFSLVSERECGIRCIPSTGRGGKTYNPNVKTRIGMVRNGVYECFDQQTRAKWLCFDSDAYREMAHLAWLGTIGAPGSCSLFAGRHDEWAQQICNEKLNGKAEIAGRMTYKWTAVPNQPHDAGDVMTMLYALAGWEGIGTGGGEVREKKKKRIASAMIGGRLIGG